MQGLRLCNAHHRSVLSFYAEVFITYKEQKRNKLYSGCFAKLGTQK